MVYPLFNPWSTSPQKWVGGMWVFWDLVELDADRRCQLAEEVLGWVDAKGVVLKCLVGASFRVYSNGWGMGPDLEYGANLDRKG